MKVFSLIVAGAILVSAVAFYIGFRNGVTYGRKDYAITESNALLGISRMIRNGEVQGALEDSDALLKFVLPDIYDVANGSRYGSLPGNKAFADKMLSGILTYFHGNPPSPMSYDLPSDESFNESSRIMLNNMYQKTFARDRRAMEIINAYSEKQKKDE